MPRSSSSVEVYRFGQRGRHTYPVWRTDLKSSVNVQLGSEVYSNLCYEETERQFVALKKEGQREKLAQRRTVNRFHINEMDFRSEPQVVIDSSTSARKSRSGASASEWRHFMSSNPSEMFRKPSTKRIGEQVHSHEEKEVFKKIFKEVEWLGTAQMTWKQRKAVERQNVLALGGKPPKNIKIPINEAKSIKKKRERMEQTNMQEELALGQPAKHVKRTVEKYKMKDRGLKASEGTFKKGVLHVKPLIKDVEKSDGSLYRIGNRKNKSKAKKQKGKKKQ